MAIGERAELEALRQRHEAMKRAPGVGSGDEDLLQRLKSLPEDEAVALLLRLRSGIPVKDNLVSARSIPSPSRTSVEFGLMHRHHIMYPFVAAVNPPEIRVSDLRILPYRELEPEATTGSGKYVSNDPFPGILRRDPTGLGSGCCGRGRPGPFPGPPRSILGTSPHARLQLADHGTPIRLRLFSRRPSSSRPSPTKPGSQQQRPSTPHPSASSGSYSHLCDPRLKHITILSWTQVPISNDLAARLISFYLTVDHPILGLFDADLFLGDLVAHKTEFCCPLLLSAVLCFACQGYSSIDADTAALSYDFFSEAQQLHEEESSGNPQYQFAIPNIAATQLLSLAATCHGSNELALRYLVEGVELAHQNGLLAVSKKDSARNWLDDHVDHVKAASQTAWGTFCRATLLGMNYQNAYIAIPPWLPIPGTAIVRSDGEVEPFELPDYVGQSFTELCRLTPLINEMLHEYYDSGDGVAPTTRASFTFAQGLYRRMLDWADSLPVSMARGDGVPHHAAIVHIYFHTAVLDLFRPFLYQRPQTPYRLDDHSADDPTPEGICKASVNQLKHLILMFRARYPCASFTMLWQNALLYVANACLPLHRGPRHTAGTVTDQMDGVTTTTTTTTARTTTAAAAVDQESHEDDTEEPEEDADRRKWFMACIDALRALAPQFGIVTSIVQGILSMAILKGSIAAVEGRAIMDQLKADTEELSRHRREQLSTLNDPGGGGVGSSAGGGVATLSTMIDGYIDVDEEEGVGAGGAGGIVAGGLREGPEAAGRVVYGSSGVRGGDGSIVAPSMLSGLHGAHPGGNGFVIDLNEASVNPSAASLDVLARAFEELVMFDEFTTGEE